MWTYQAPLDEMRFAMTQWLDAPASWCSLPAFAQLDWDTADQVLEQAEKFALEHLLPINGPGDLVGCQWQDGRVTTPPGYRQAWQEFVAAGWPAMACDPQWQGQGLPQLLHAAAYEMWFSCCHAWSMYPGLGHGAFECLRHFGSPELKAQYLPKLASGEWLATMCLTEAHAGSDVGLLRTRAEPDANDGSAWRLSGAKIFISGGEQDLTDNIVHLVLARLPDAPAGSRGISLFLVPKLIDGVLNGVRCTGIEKKMGIKGSATCAMQFDHAKGWLIGAPNKGLAAMFVMMNAARLHVALQGMAHAQIAHQNALAYAQERRQMRAVKATNSEQTASAADPIVLHPAVRRHLLEQRAIIQAQRFLSYWAAHLLDMGEHHPDEHVRQQALQRVSLLTPVLKSLLTEYGFLLSSSALQLFGGHGYIHDTGVEQTLRDSRITLLYEGTTEIQAIDLVMRKIGADQGAALRELFAEIQQELNAGLAIAELAPLIARLAQAGQDVEGAVQTLFADRHDPERPLRGAADFLWLLGVSLMGYALIRAARRAQGHASAASRLETARVFCDFVLPQVGYRRRLLEAACQHLPAVASD